jgi:hypothetical protein
MNNVFIVYKTLFYKGNLFIIHHSPGLKGTINKTQFCYQAFWAPEKNQT